MISVADIKPAPVAFQGFHGAYSDLACREAFPERPTLPCRTFEDTIAALHAEQAGIAMIPIDNTVAGRVADVYHLIPESNLHIVGEHFHRVRHHLMARPGVALEQIRQVGSHVHALSQCRDLIRGMNLEVLVEIDTAGAAQALAASENTTKAVIASRLAAEIHGLNILRSNIEDADHNTTRFLIMSKHPISLTQGQGETITTFVFRVRSVPAALYKALGGFATNGVNMTKLESYMIGAHFDVAQFYADIEGHPEDRLVRLALEELDFFSREVRILGTYPAHPFRLEQVVLNRRHL